MCGPFWCPTCYAEHSYLNKLAAQGVKIIGMNYKDDRNKAVGWLKESGNPYLISLFDGDGMLGLDLGVYGAPETFLIDANGVVRYRHVGDVNPTNWASTLEPMYQELLEGSEMIKKALITLFATFAISATVSAAPIEFHEFDTVDQEQQFKELE